MKRVKQVIFAGVLLASCMLPAWGKTAEPGNTAFRQAISQLMNSRAGEGFSGALLVARKGEVVISRGYGQSNRQANTPFTGETVIDINSVTKQFIGAAILRLEAQGKLTSYDRLGQHLPGLKGHLAGITLHQLLTHSSGLTDATGDDYAPLTLPQLIDQLNSQPLSHPEGTYHYSNLGYSLLTAVVEQSSGQSIDEFLTTQFFNPLGMRHTGYRLPGFSEAQVAHGYRDGEDWGRPNDKPWMKDGPYWNLRGNGGLLSTPGDMYTWFKALRTDQVFSEAARHKLFGLHVQEQPGTQSFYGYGWVTQIFKDGKHLIWHDGGNGIFSVDLKYYPESDVFFFLVGNQAEQQIWPTSLALHKLIRRLGQE